MPTPIQQQAIPILLQGRDVCGIAQTGTGKTAGFTLPMLQALAGGRAKARMPRSLILEPTRELAAQVGENFETYGKYERLNYALLIGGSSMDEQVRKLDRGVDVLIATPGRMLDLFERGKVLLADVRILVIDEADRMLDMGFIPDIERIVSLLPAGRRQTLMFSATMPREIRRLAEAFLNDPVEIAVAPPATTAERVEQFMVVVPVSEKREALRRLLRAEEVRNALVFCNRKRDVSVVYHSLVRHGFNAGQLHGDMPQPARTETLERFKRGDIQILVCSDVAARGLDISGLSHVVNFDVPHNPEDYVHRIGRTGRAGLSGRALTLAAPDDAKSVAAIAKLTKQTIPAMAVPDMEPAVLDSAPVRERRRRGAKSEAPRAARSERAARPEREARPDRESRPSRESRTEREARSERDEPATRPEAAPPPERLEPPAPRNPRPARPPARPRGGEEPRVVGLGDHVPAFLLRPVRRTASA